MSRCRVTNHKLHKWDTNVNTCLCIPETGASLTAMLMHKSCPKCCCVPQDNVEVMVDRLSFIKDNLFGSLIKCHCRAQWGHSHQSQTVQYAHLHTLMDNGEVKLRLVASVWENGWKSMLTSSAWRKYFFFFFFTVLSRESQETQNKSAQLFIVFQGLFLHTDD